MDWGDFLLEFAFGITSSLITDVGKVEWHIFILGSIVRPGMAEDLKIWGGKLRCFGTYADIGNPT